MPSGPSEFFLPVRLYFYHYHTICPSTKSVSDQHCHPRSAALHAKATRTPSLASASRANLAKSEMVKVLHASTVRQMRSRAVCRSDAGAVLATTTHLSGSCSVSQINCQQRPDQFAGPAAMIAWTAAPM